MKVLLSGSDKVKKSGMSRLGKENLMDTFKEYCTSVLVGIGVLFLLFGIATSIHYSLILVGVGVGISSILYLLWRLL